MKIGLRKWIFSCQGFFYNNFDLENECKNDFNDNNEKFCSWSRNRVSNKIDFTAIWTQESIAEACELILGILKIRFLLFWALYCDFKYFFLNDVDFRSRKIFDLVAVMSQIHVQWLINIAAERSPPKIICPLKS